MNNTIHLPIKREWFDMILSGEKKEEYREIKQYWAKRLNIELSFAANGKIRSWERSPSSDHKTTATLTAGYGKDKPRMVVELTGVAIKHPNPAWCPPETEGLWFALKLGEVLETHNLPVLSER
jgi:hypothetical protein